MVFVGCFFLLVVGFQLNGGLRGLINKNTRGWDEAFIIQWRRSKYCGNSIKDSTTDKLKYSA